MQGEKERRRLLNILAKESAELEWPCRNAELLAMVDEGLVEISRRYQSQWGGCSHNMVSLKLTAGGLAELGTL